MTTAAIPTHLKARSSVSIPANSLLNMGVAAAVFTGGFVLFEPAPYELLLAALMGVAFLLGLRVPKPLLFPLLAVSLFTLGGIIASFWVRDLGEALIYNAVTFFLGLTTVFFAAIIAQDMGRLRLIFRAYVVAALVSSSLGILGYFSVPGFAVFTRYDRAQGVFADPNVFAPFLIPAILYLLYGVLKRSITKLPLRLAALLLLLLAEFLAFSRGGWGMTLLTGFLFYALLFINETSVRQRVKYVLVAICGIAGLLVGLIGALQVDAIADIFVQRARLVQDYDGARLGRFARHAIGFEIALSHPLGLGTLEFGRQWGEDEHNVYMRALLSYGWLGFAGWLAFILVPLARSFRLLFLNRPWQVYLQIAYVVAFGHLFLAWIIDIDHWRHFYLLIGIIWGCILLEQRVGRGVNDGQMQRLRSIRTKNRLAHDGASR